MSNLTTTNTTQSLGGLLQNPKTTDRLKEILGKRASTFSTSVLQIYNSNALLKNCEPQSILNAALIATTLELPINNSLGMAYIVPYGNKAQLQLGYRAFIQLAQRSGQFKRINTTDVRAGEIKVNNRLTGEIEFEWLEDREGKEVVGYVSFFELLNGYSHTLYMTKSEVEAHAKKYSQTYKKYGTGLWKDEFDSMAKKTVLKLLLSKFAPLSVEMQRAEIADQSVINDYDGDTIDVDYVDNTPEVIIEVTTEQKELDRLKENLATVLTLEELSSLEQENEFSDAEKKLINTRRKELSKNK